MSPIRPENRDRYPSDWPAISLRIKERAGWRCECEGECGRGTHDGSFGSPHSEDGIQLSFFVQRARQLLDRSPHLLDCPSPAPRISQFFQGGAAVPSDRGVIDVRLDSQRRTENPDVDHGRRQTKIQ